MYNMREKYKTLMKEIKEPHEWMIFYVYGLKKCALSIYQFLIKSIPN